LAGKDEICQEEIENVIQATETSILLEELTKHSDFLFKQRL